MTDAQRSFFAFGLIAIVLVLTPRYLEWLAPASSTPPAAESSMFDTPDDEYVPEIAVSADEPAEVDIVAQQQVFQEQIWRVEAAHFIATISSRAGGSIAAMELLDHASGLSDGNVQMVPQQASLPTPFIAYINMDGDSVALVDNWEVLSAPRGGTISLSDGESATFSFRQTMSSGAEVTRQIVVHSDDYQFPMTVKWLRPALELGINSFEVQWPAGMLPAESLISEDELYSKVYVYQGGELEDLGAQRGGSEPRQNLSGSTEWVAMRNKYFTAALIADPQSPGSYGALSAKSTFADEVGLPEEESTRYMMALGYQAQPITKLSLYMGPLSYGEIKGLDVDLERIMNFGFALIRPFSKGILWLLVALHDYIPNFGVILLLFALGVRVLTNPLTKKSAVSTQKMQMIQPRITELQAKYKGNPQKLNQEMMALWRSEGVNPLGGCLPILIQLPLLWAFFIVFRTTIELRGQPFIFWVKDLSVPDVIFTLPFSIPLYGDGVTVLAIIMGATMFLQQKISGAGNNPQQKPMMYIMTGMFFLLFNRFPSGLNLYYAFSNMLAIVQQRNIRKGLEAAGIGTNLPKVPDVAVKKSPKGSTKSRSRKKKGR